MRLISMLGILVLLALCICGPYPGEVIADNADQEDAEKLLRTAEELTDIRAVESHPFRLAASVKVFDEKARPTDGVYSLVWKGPTDWQEKLRLGDFSQERSAAGDKLFTSRSTSSFTLEIYQLLKLMDFPNLLRVSPDARAEKLRERMKDGSRVREVELSFPGHRAWKTIFFDESSPTPILVEYKDSHFGYRFENYAPFEAHQFPRLLIEFDSNKPLVQIQVQELTEATSSDSAFSPSPGARWYKWCLHPEPRKSLDMGKVFPIPWPLRGGPLERPVAIYGVLGTDGKWHNLTVVKSGGKEVDQYWMDVMRQSHYSPATCGGIPVLYEYVSEFGRTDR